MRGTGESEKLLKNAKTELCNEYEEIGNYVAIETLAQSLGDKDTEKLAREFRKQEERMANFLVKLLPQLTKAVAKEEIPAAERRTNGGSPRRSARQRSTRRRLHEPRVDAPLDHARVVRSSSSRRAQGRRRAAPPRASRPARAAARPPALSSRSRRTAAGSKS